MIKKLMLWIVTIFVLALGVSAASAGNVSITSTNPESATADVNDVISKIVTIKNANTGSALSVSLPSTVNFIGTKNNETGVAVTYNETTIPVSIAADSSRDINYTFTVPSDAYAEPYTGIINFTSGASNYAELTFTLTVNSASNLTAGNVDLDIAQGQTGTATLTLTNIGNTDITGAALPSSVTLTSITNSSNTLTAAIAATSLDADYKSTNTTTITVPVLASAARETYQKNVTVSYDGKSVDFLISVDVVAPSYSLSVKGAYFGDTEQNTTVSTTVTIKNTGNALLTNANLSSNLDDKYKVVFNQTTPFNLGINDTRAILVTAFIPEDESANNHSIGSVGVLSDQHNFTSAISLHANVKGKLMIDDLDVIVDKDIEGSRVSSTNMIDGDTIDEKARPGSKIEVEIKLRNQFSDESEIDINNVEITITAKDLDQGDDIEEVSGEFDIDADSTETKTVEFIVPLIVERDTYEIGIHVEGEDDNGADHEIDWVIYLRVDKKSHDVIVYDAEVQPSTLRCSRRTSLNIDLLNLGRNEEDEVKLEVKNSALDLDFVERNIDLDVGTEEDNIFEKAIPIELGQDVKAGTYPININVYYDNTILDDYKTVELIVEDCKIVEKEEKEGDEVVIVDKGKEEGDTTGPEIIIGDIPTDTEADVSVEKPFTQSAGYVALLLIGNVVILAGLLGLAAKFLLARPPVGPPGYI